MALDGVAAYPVITIGDPLDDPSLGYELWSANAVQPEWACGGHRLALALLNSLAGVMVRTDGLGVWEVTNRHLCRDVGLWWHAEAGTPPIPVD